MSLAKTGKHQRVLISAPYTDDSPRQTPTQLWSWPASQPTLGENDVDVWRAALAAHPMYVQRAIKFLSKDEIERADRFYRRLDRNNFIVARVFLRIIAARYLGKEPGDLTFNYGNHGKPSIANAGKDGRHLEFNLTHSGGVALYAFAFGRKVGIDLEEVQPGMPYEETARSVFSPAEVESLSSVSPADREKAFYTCWVRKEAFVKATGGGLSIDLDRFDVTLGDGQQVLSRIGWNDEEVKCWSIRPIEIGSRYVAAIAVQGHDWQPKYWNAQPLTHRIINQMPATSARSYNATIESNWLTPSE